MGAWAPNHGSWVGHATPCQVSVGRASAPLPLLQVQRLPGRRLRKCLRREQIEKTAVGAEAGEARPSPPEPWVVVKGPAPFG